MLAPALSTGPMRAALKNPAARGAAALARTAGRVKASTPVRGMASGKDIKFGNDARSQLLIGVDRLAEAVKVTLGPKVCLFPLDLASSEAAPWSHKAKGCATAASV